jgi:NAD-dependent deacetylase
LALVELEHRGRLRGLVTQNVDGLHQKAGEKDPACLDCGGILKSATISFGQSPDQAVLDASVEAARECDLFVAIHTDPIEQILPRLFS